MKSQIQLSNLSMFDAGRFSGMLDILVMTSEISLKECKELEESRNKFVFKKAYDVITKGK